MNFKKMVVVVLFLMVITVASGFAAGGFRLGLEFGNPSVVAVIRVNPFDFKIGYNFYDIGEGNLFIHVSGDYRIIEIPLIDFLNFYLGAGLYAQIFTAGEGDFNFGGRIPVGINAYLAKSTVELFLEVVPTVLFLPGLGWGGLQGYLGFTIRIPKF